MKFFSEAARLEHQIVRLIPNILWHSREIFEGEISEKELAIMTSDLSVSDAPSEIVQSLHWDFDRRQLKYWLCLLLGHPDASSASLLRAAQRYSIAPDIIFKGAILSNRSSILNEIEMDPAVIKRAISDDGYLVFRYASSLVYLDSVAKLSDMLTAEENIIMMKDPNTSFVFRRAAIDGHLAIFNWLKTKFPDQVQPMMIPDSSRVFCDASRNGHLHVLNWLKAEFPDQLQSMIARDSYKAFIDAALSGHIAVLNWLEAEAPEQLQAMVKADDYKAFRFASSAGNIAVIRYLLCFPGCLAYAESHENEYDLATHPFIRDKLISLRGQRSTLEIANHHAVFNITDAEEAKICFYILRNLIRRDDVTLLDDIRFLLEIPAVKALAHAEVNAGQSNELVRLALATGNRTAAEILLNIPAVRELASRHDFYRAETNGGFDLRGLARDSESSMHLLSTGEQKRLAAATTRYQLLMQAAGVEHLFDTLREALVHRYQEHPATITIAGVKKVLPVGWLEFKALTLTLTHEQREEALKAYYQHQDHTALRYLGNPNHWMAEDASYVYINEDGTQRWCTFEEYKPLIVMLWLAVNDEGVEPTDGHTLEGRIAHFINELAHIGRAHNWDRSRPRADGHGTEEFDDLAGDKPSCFSGVNRRLFQSVIGHPLLIILTADDVRQEISAFIWAKFSARITEENRAKLLAVWNKLIALDEVDTKPLTALNITPVERAEFSEYMNRKYGAQFNNEPAFTTLMTQLCPEDNIHAQACDGLFDMLRLFKLPVSTTAACGGAGARATNTSGFFATKADTATTPADAGKGSQP